MRALVTGGAGFIGRHLIDHLLRKGMSVTAIDSGFTGQINKVNKEANLLVNDIDNFSEEEWSDILKGVNFVFHLAAQKHNTQNVLPEKMISTNVTATYKLAMASAKNKVNRFVFTSSLYAHGSLGPTIMKESDIPKPMTLYGASKLMGEHILRVAQKQYGLKWNAARLYFIYGPGQYADGGYKSVIIKNLERIRDGLSATINGNGLQSLDYVYVEDAVEALELIANHSCENEIFNVSSAKLVSINELINSIETVLKQSVKKEFIPADWTNDTHRYGDNTLISETISWKPKTTLTVGLSKTWDFIKNQN